MITYYYIRWVPYGNYGFFRNVMYSMVLVSIYAWRKLRMCMCYLTISRESRLLDSTAFLSTWNGCLACFLSSSIYVHRLAYCQSSPAAGTACHMLAPEAQGSNILRLPRCLSSLDQSPDLMLSSIGQQGFPLPSLSPFVQLCIMI